MPAEMFFPDGGSVLSYKLEVDVACAGGGLTIAPGETCELRFLFKPVLVGSYKGTIVVDTDDPTSPYSFSWVGEGIA